MTGGGVMTLVKNDKLDCEPISKINDLSIEYHCELTAMLVEDLNLIVVNIYRSPKDSFDTFLYNLQRLFNYFYFSKNIIVCGDFNVIFNVPDKDAISVTDFFHSYNFTSRVNFNTRGNNRHDNVFFNFNIDKSYCLNDLDTSKVITP